MPFTKQQQTPSQSLNSSITPQADIAIPQIQFQNFTHTNITQPMEVSLPSTPNPTLATPTHYINFTPSPHH